MKREILNSYLARAQNLLDFRDEHSICYCALELRKAIEFIVWSQFKDAFFDIVTYKTQYNFFDFILNVQSQSISKMYKMLKKFVPDYVQIANGRVVTNFSEAYGNAPLKSIGKTCYIDTELPNNDYKYLSEVLHYDKEFLPKSYKIDKKKLKGIYKKLIFIRDNYNFPIIPTASGKDKEIIEDLETNFNLK